MHSIFATEKPKTDQAIFFVTFDITHAPHETFCKLTFWPDTNKCFSHLMMLSSGSGTHQIPIKKTFSYSLPEIGENNLITYFIFFNFGVLLIQLLFFLMSNIKVQRQTMIWPIKTEVVVPVLEIFLSNCKGRLPMSSGTNHSTSLLSFLVYS